MDCKNVSCVLISGLSGFYRQTAVSFSLWWVAFFYVNKETVGKPSLEGGGADMPVLCLVYRIKGKRKAIQFFACRNIFSVQI